MSVYTTGPISALPNPLPLPTFSLPVFSSGPLSLPLASLAACSSTSTPLLPATLPSPSASSPKVPPGCPTLPAKMVAKILSKEYFDLADLLPDQLRAGPSSLGGPLDRIVVLPESLFEANKRKRRQIPDIAAWVRVYSIYMLYLGHGFPELLPELIAYQLFIVQHSLKFEYPSWLHYDMEFRQWAAANKFEAWAQIHPQFYAFAFTAQARVSSWCSICQVDGGSHALDCPRLTTKLPPASQPRPAAPLGPSGSKRPKLEHCIIFNKNNGSCPYGRGCKFEHRCAFCGKLGHPVSACPAKSSH